LRSKRKVILLATAIAVLTLLVAAVPALANTFTPDDGASPN
jgi:hypothetical protein